MWNRLLKKTPTKQTNRKYPQNNPTKKKKEHHTTTPAPKNLEINPKLVNTLEGIL